MEQELDEEGIVYEYDDTAVGCISRRIVSMTEEYKKKHPELVEAMM